MNEILDEYLDLKSLSRYARIGVSTLRYHIRENDLAWFGIRGKKKTGKILVKRSEFDAWMEQFRGNIFIDPEAVADEVLESLNLRESDR